MIFNSIKIIINSKAISINRTNIFEEFLRSYSNNLNIDEDLIKISRYVL